ncbi:MAG: hypothetical protein Q9166_008013 [cf. Caloplaca sp. 2 TL-2023]
MTTAQIISRRKPATYGKPSRKPSSYYFAPSTFDSVRSSPNSPALQGRIAAPQAQNHSSLKVSQSQERMIQEVSLSSGLRKLVGTCPTPVEYPRSWDLPRDGRGSRISASAEMWDMSSSDVTGTDLEFDQANTRKKRKVLTPLRSLKVKGNEQGQKASTASYEQSPIISSSDKLLDVTRSLYPDLESSSAPMDKYQPAFPTSPPHGPARKRLRGLDMQASSKSKRSRVAHGKRMPRSYKKVPRSVTRPASPQTVTGFDETRAHDQSQSARSRDLAALTFDTSIEYGKRSLSPTPRTPTHKKNLANATTPHQQELWDMLSSSREFTCPSTPEMRSMGEPSHRRRLIDKLQPARETPEDAIIDSSGLTVLPKVDGGDELSFEKTSLIDVVYRANPPHTGSLSSTDMDVLPPPNIRHQLPPEDRPKATYSSQRSYLATGDLDDAFSFGGAGFDDSQPLAGDMPRKRVRTGTFPLDEGLVEAAKDGKLTGSQGNSMRTIHELREAGENVRHLNDTEALFEDIDGQGLTSIALKRRRLLDLARRLQEPAFCRSLLDQGFDDRLLSQPASRDNDAIADALLAVAVLHLVAASLGRQATSPAYDLRVANLFATKLDRDQDLISVIRNRRSNISKQDQSDLKDYFVDTIFVSPVWRGGVPTKFSTRWIALQGLEYLIRNRREADCKIQVLPPKIIQRLAEGLPSAREIGIPSKDLLLETRLAISILESYSISGASHDDQQWTDNTLEPIIAVLSWLNCIPQGGGEDVQKLTLRLCLNLTNNNPRLCDIFAKRNVLRAMLSVIQSRFQILPNSKQGRNGSSVLDTLILALGALINLVEWSSTAHDIMTSEEDHGDCFLQSLVYSEEETSSNVAFGYLSVLLSYLCVEKHARQMVVNQLQGGNLKPLLDAVEEFLQYHQQIDEEIAHGNREMGSKASFISRLESTLLKLRGIG